MQYKASFSDIPGTPAQVFTGNTGGKWVSKRGGGERWTGNPCFSEGKNRMAPSQLGSATCSVLDIVRTDLRTVLAIALGKARVPARAGLGG